MVRCFRLVVALLLLGVGMASSLGAPRASADIGPCRECPMVQVTPVVPLPGNAVVSQGVSQFENR